MCVVVWFVFVSSVLVVVGVLGNCRMWFVEECQCHGQEVVVCLLVCLLLLDVCVTLVYLQNGRLEYG